MVRSEPRLRSKGEAPNIWSRLSFSSQFFVAAAIVLFVAMAVLGTWVNEQIKHSVLVTSGAQGANFMNGFLEPLVQDINPDGTLPPRTHAQLDTLFVGTPLGQTVVSIKIWVVEATQATVIYSTTKDLIGDQFISTDVARAASGEVVAEYEDLISQESAYEQTLDMALIEVYAPLYRTGTDEVIAVGEIYENADALAAELTGSQLNTWIVVCLTTILMLAVLYAIVRRGSRTIALQRSDLQRHVAEAREMARQNTVLRVAADRARLDASEANEQLLARIGSDIHDGPIQLLSLFMLKFTSLEGSGGDEGGRHRSLQTLLDSALNELRTISSGLSLPEIEELSPREALELAVFRHEDIAGTRVKFEFGDLPDTLTHATKICAYRVIQEGLSNATKHAPGAAQTVSAGVIDGWLHIEVLDDGPGVPRTEIPVGGKDRLGLAGMRNRVGALQGTIELGLAPGGVGTRIKVALPLEDSDR
eukprot:jgi/Tetstr1/452208/TSEL_039244.t1